MKNELEKELQELRKEISSLKEKEKLREQAEFSKTKRISKSLKVLLVFSLSLFSLYGIAVISQLHVFSPGDPISAQEINENFEYLESLIGSGGGGVTVESITTQQTKTLTATDANKFLIIDSVPVVVQLPDISSVPAGYRVQMKQIKGGQFVVRPFGSDNIEQTNDDLYVNNENGLAEFISDGFEWSTLLVIGMVERFDYDVALSNVCTSDGGVSSCYDSTILNDTSINYALVNGFLVKKNTMNAPYYSWQLAHVYHYLIDDKRSEYSIDFTSNWSFFDYTLTSGKTTGGLYYWTMDYTCPSCDDDNVSNIVYGLSGEEDHVTASQTGNANYLNTIGTGSKCTNRNSNARFPTLSETSFDGTINGSRIEVGAVDWFWTATPQTSPVNGNDTYVQFQDGSQRESGWDGSQWMRARTICVLDSQPLEEDFL